ncbi:hypothetical protein LPJ53_005012 [Coemansia erecta]|uniref:Uncharacterized protein n=1 Tax=Coemansia erecta TaxID=147472 RepID=A0A9W7XXR2_9FUNG|nr:hypothetical protein LPJ53_005012 [Coemansia erecta]
MTKSKPRSKPQQKQAKASGSASSVAAAAAAAADATDKEAPELGPSSAPAAEAEAATAAAADDAAAASSSTSSQAKPKQGTGASKQSPTKQRPTRSVSQAGTATKRGSSAVTHRAGPSAPVLVSAPTPAGAFGIMSQPPGIENELSLMKIIEEYGERTDLLRLVLASKTEQDRARAEYERRLQEELRYETRRIEFEMMLHGNLFKQQEREHEEKRQQQLMPPPPAVPAGMHRADMVLHSPIGHLQTGGHHAYPHKQQQQQQQHLAHYGPPHDPHNHTRSYHHPDTPGGPDVRPNPHPFAFFKSPLGGAPINHPSAFGQQQPGGRQPGTAAASGGGSSTATHEPTRQLGIRERRTVAPAVSGLSVRTADGGHGLMGDGAPRSAPVDGPAMHGKRKISHDEVIMALRRKVMSKSGAHVQATSAMADVGVQPRRSSLAVITSVASEDEGGPAGDAELGSVSSVSSSESSALSVAGSQAGVEAGRQQRRLPSISAMLEAEGGSGASKDDADAGQEQPLSSSSSAAATNGKSSSN